MNLDYDTGVLDKKKLKIEKTIEEIEQLILEPKKEQVVVEFRPWTEAFDHFIRTISSIDANKKLYVKSNLIDIKLKKIPAQINKKTK